MEKDVLEKKILELLELVAAKGIREFYEDACSILSCDNLRAPEKAIGNYLREIESALFSVTVSLAKLDTDISKYENEGKLSRAGQITLVTEYFKLGLGDEQIKFWKGIELQRLAHRSGLKSNKRISGTFIEEVWMPYSIIILEVAEGINKVFLGYYERLEGLAKIPSKDNCRTVLQEIPNNPHLRAHFFEQIEDFHSWLPMLKSKNIFGDVPLEYANEEGYLVTQPWSPLSFLLRIINETQDDETQEMVAKIAANIPVTENLRVNGDLLILAGKLPAQLSSQHLMPRIKAALDSKGLYTMGEKISSLLVKLDEGHFSKSLLEIAEKVISDENLNPFFEERYIKNNMNFYYYNGLLTVLSNFNNVGIFQFLLERSLEGLLLSFKDNKSEKFGTMHWKHAFNDEIEKDKLSSMYVSKLSLAVKNLIASEKTKTSEFIKILCEANKGQDWYIINALILDLLETSEDQIDNDLKSELQEKLTDYEANRREREEPQARWVVHVSPYSNEELSKLAADEVLNKLEQYDGPIEDTWDEAPSRTGLLQNIEHQIKERPGDFVKYVEAFKKLTDNDYACLMYYFSQAEFEPDSDFVNNYLLLVNEFIEYRYDASSEENRRNFSRSLFGIFRKIYSTPETYLSMDSVAFRALDKIIRDQSISSAIFSSTRKDRFRELANHAINTPSIEAFSCLLDCYLTPNTKWKAIREREDINDFKSYVLMIVQIDESAPFRFSIGEKVHSLLGIGKEWFINDLGKIVLNKDLNDPWEAFVAGAMAQNIICNDVLGDVYRDAVRYVSTEEYLSKHQEQDNFSIEKGVARHSSFYYCQLDDQNCTEGSLTNYIFVHGSQPLKRLFLVEAKKQLKNDDGGRKAFNRIKELIDWRYEELRRINFAPDKVQELSGLFSLFPVIVKFDPEWSLKRLSEFMDLLETNGEPFHPDMIIDALIEQAEESSLITAKCLLAWVRNMKNKWHDFNDVQRLIEKLHQYGDADTHDILKEVVSRLSSRGICREMIALFKQG